MISRVAPYPRRVFLSNGPNTLQQNLRHLMGEQVIEGEMALRCRDICMPSGSEDDFMVNLTNYHPQPVTYEDIVQLNDILLSGDSDHSIFKSEKAFLIRVGRLHDSGDRIFPIKFLTSIKAGALSLNRHYHLLSRDASNYDSKSAWHLIYRRLTAKLSSTIETSLQGYDFKRIFCWVFLPLCEVLVALLANFISCRPRNEARFSIEGVVRLLVSHTVLSSHPLTNRFVLLFMTLLTVHSPAFKLDRYAELGVTYPLVCELRLIEQGNLYPSVLMTTVTDVLFNLLKEMRSVNYVTIFEQTINGSLGECNVLNLLPQDLLILIFSFLIEGHDLKNLVNQVADSSS